MMVGNALLGSIQRALGELGLITIWRSSLDVKLLCAQRFVRMFAYGGSTLILASYLSALSISDDRIGLFMTLTLAGDVGISFLLTLFADAMGRRMVLSLGSIMMIASGVVFALFQNYWILLAAAVFGVISPSGNEIGPFRAVEESTIAHLTQVDLLSDVFAWYSLSGTAGSAFGLLICGWIINTLQSIYGWQFIPSCRVIFAIYACVGFAKLAFTLGLSRKVEANQDKENRQDSETRPLVEEPDTTEGDAEQPKGSMLASLDGQLLSLVIRLFILFGLDSFASGLASLSWMTYFFQRKFRLAEGELGTIFFVSSIIAAASMLVASSIAKRIGNVKTMVFTHLPSAVCLSLIAIPSGLPLALTFLVLRACSQSMDVVPRSAFLAAALPVDKRTAIMGAVNVVKTISQSLGPLLTGVLARMGYFGLSFIIAGCLKVIYDLGMLFSFVGYESKRRRQIIEDAGESNQ